MKKHPNSIVFENPWVVLSAKQNIIQTLQYTEHQSLPSYAYYASCGQQTIYDTLIAKEFTETSIRTPEKIYPLNEKMAISGSLYHHADIKQLYIKGGAPLILDICDLSQSEHERLSLLYNAWCAKGLDVIAIAYKEPKEIPNSITDEKHVGTYSLIGLIGISQYVDSAIKSAFTHSKIDTSQTLLLSSRSFESTYHIVQQLQPSLKRTQGINASLAHKTPPSSLGSYRYISELKHNQKTSFLQSIASKHASTLVRTKADFTDLQDKAIPKIIKRVSKKGFSLVEILIAITVMAVITGVVIVISSAIIQRARDSSVVQDVGEMYESQLLYITSHTSPALTYNSEGEQNNILAFSLNNENNVVVEVKGGNDFCVYGYNARSSFPDIEHAYIKKRGSSDCGTPHEQITEDPLAVIESTMWIIAQRIKNFMDENDGRPPQLSELSEIGLSVLNNSKKANQQQIYCRHDTRATYLQYDRGSSTLFTYDSQPHAVYKQENAPNKMTLGEGCDLLDDTAPGFESTGIKNPDFGTPES